MTTAEPAELAALSEADYVDRIIDTAQRYGWHVAHFRPARTARGWRTPMQGHPGFPDLVLARAGRVLLVEVKTDRGRVRREQWQWLDALGDHGHLWRPRDWRDVLETLQPPEADL